MQEHGEIEIIHVDFGSLCCNYMEDHRYCWWGIFWVYWCFVQKSGSKIYLHCQWRQDMEGLGGSIISLTSSEGNKNTLIGW